MPNKLLTRDEFVEEVSKPFLRAIVTDLLRHPPKPGEVFVIQPLFGDTAGALLSAPEDPARYKAWIDGFYDGLEKLGGPTPGFDVPPRPRLTAES